MAVVARVALFIVCSVVALAAAGPLTRGLPGKWSPFVVGSVASVVAFATTLLFTRWDRIQLSDVGAAIEARSWLRAAAGFLIGLILAGLQTLSVVITSPARLAPADDLSAGAAGIALLTYIALACREELAFRGYPLRRLDRYFGPWIAQFAIALAFAVEHVAGGYSWTNAMLGVTMGSLLFGMAALATRGLAVPIGLHSAWNFGQWALGGKETQGLWKVVADGRFHDRIERAGMIGYLVVMSAATFGFWLLFRKRNAQIGEITHVKY